MLSPPARVVAHDPVATANGFRPSGRAQKRLWVTSAAATQAVGTLHTVQTGETLAQIALAYGVPVEQIQEAKPKGIRNRRATLRADVALKPGQELLVPSDGRSAESTRAVAASAPVPPGFTAQIPPQLLAAGLGGLLLTAGVARLLIAKDDTPATTAAPAIDPTSLQAADSSALPAAAIAATPRVSSAVAEVRALLQDAAVEVHAVESALAAVRRAAQAARAAPSSGAAAATPLSTAPPAQANGTSAHAGAAGSGPAAMVAPSAVVAHTAPLAHSEMALEAAPATASLFSSEAAPPAPIDAASHVEAPVEDVSGLEDGRALQAAVLAVADADAAATTVETEAATTAAAPAPAAPAWPDLDAFDTATQVAAARARVEAALAAARGLFAPQLPATAAAGAAAQAPLPLVTADDTLSGSDSDETGEVVMVAEVEALGRPLDAASAGQVLQRIRVINRLLEEEQQRAGPGPATAAAAVDVPAGGASASAPTSAPTAPLVDRERAAGLLVKVDRLLSSFDDIDLELNEPTQQQRQAPAQAAAAGSGSHDDVSTLPTDAELLPPLPQSGAAPPPPPSPSTVDSSTTAKLRLFLPTATPPPALLGAGSGGLPVGVGVGASPPAPAAAAPTAASLSDGAAPAPASVASVLEEAVRPLAGSIPGPVLDRFRDIGRLLEEEQRKGDPPAVVDSASAGVPQLDTAARTVAAAAAGATAAVAGAAAAAVASSSVAAAAVPPSVLGALNRAFQAPPASPRQSVDEPPSAPPPPLPHPAPQPQLQSPPPPSPQPESPWAPEPTPLPASLPQAAQPLSSAPLPQPQAEGGTGSASAAATAAGSGAPHTARADATLVNLKSGLLDLVYGTARGVNANALQRAAIEEFVAALEARNPNAAPTDAVSALVGRWKLVYTSNLPTLLLLGALDGMPLVEIGDVVQTIHPDSLTATNKIDLSVPLLVSLRAEAGLEVRSPRQFKVRLSRLGLDTYVATPQLTAALEVPPSVSIMGATLDLAPLRGMVDRINAGIQAAQGLLDRATSPELELAALPLPPGVSAGAVSDAASVWMLTTYLDDSLRISRDDEGRVFIMMKDVGIYPNDVPARSSPR